MKAAIELFAEQGYDAVSVRAVTKKARANLGAVGYHFGSKESLFEESLRSVTRPLNNRRLGALDALETGGKAPSLRDILDAFTRALLEATTESTSDESILYRLINRTFAESDEVARRVFREEMQPLAIRFRDAVHRACPGLSAEQAGMGLALYAGAMINALRWLTQPVLPGLFQSCTSTQPDVLLNSLLDFGKAGFVAMGQKAFRPGRRKSPR